MENCMIRLSILLVTFVFTSTAFAWDVPFASTLTGTAEGMEVLKFFNWSIQSVAYLFFMALILLAANRFSKEQYTEGLTTFVAAVVAGTAPYLARSLIGLGGFMRNLKDYFTKISVATVLSFLLFSWAVGVANMVVAPVAKAEFSKTLTQPEGLMKDNTKVKGATDMLNWIVLSVCTLLTIVFGINAGKKLNDEQYVGAIGPLLGAVVAGTATFLAYSIMS